jgi:hypothetical protein
MSNFEAVVKKVISENKMENLSDSMGWPKVREIRRKLDAKTITPDQAVDEFLTARDSYRGKRTDRDFKMKMTRLIH